MMRFGSPALGTFLVCSFTLSPTLAYAGAKTAVHEVQDGRFLLQTSGEDTVLEVTDDTMRLVRADGLAIEIPSAGLDPLTQKAFRPFGGATSSLLLDIATAGFTVTGLVAQHTDTDGNTVEDIVTTDDLGLEVTGLVIDITTYGYRFPVRSYSVSGLAIDLPSTGIHGYIGETEKNLGLVVIDTGASEPDRAGRFSLDGLFLDDLVIDITTAGISGSGQSEDVPCGITGLVIDLADDMAIEDLILDDLVIDITTAGISTGGSGGEDTIVPSGLVIDITTAGISTGGSGGEDTIAPDTLMIDLYSTDISTGELRLDFAAKGVDDYPLALGSLTSLEFGDSSGGTTPWPFFPGITPGGDRGTITLQPQGGFSKGLFAPSAQPSDATVVAFLGGKHLELYEEQPGTFVIDAGPGSDFAITVADTMLTVELFDDGLIVEVDGAAETLTLSDEHGVIEELTDSYYLPFDAELLDIGLRFETTSEDELEDIIAGYADTFTMDLDRSLDLFPSKIDVDVSALTSLSIADEAADDGAQSRFDLQLDLTGLDIDQIDLDRVCVKLNASDSYVNRMNLIGETPNPGHSLVLDASEIEVLDTAGTIEKIKLTDSIIGETIGAGEVELIVE